MFQERIQVIRKLHPVNKTHQIHLRLSESEYQKLKEPQIFLDCPSYASLIRMYIHTGICYRIDYQGLSEVAAQIAKVGNNVNQIATVANSTKEVTPSQLQSVKKELERHQNYLKREEIKEAARKETAKARRDAMTPAQKNLDKSALKISSIRETDSSSISKDTIGLTRWTNKQNAMRMQQIMDEVREKYYEDYQKTGRTYAAKTPFMNIT